MYTKNTLKNGVYVQPRDILATREATRWIQSTKFNGIHSGNTKRLRAVGEFDQR